MYGAMRTVFLSSTSKDLESYREAAYRAIEGLDGYRCVRMEDFGSRDAVAGELLFRTAAGHVTLLHSVFGLAD